MVAGWPRKPRNEHERRSGVPYPSYRHALSVVLQHEGPSTYLGVKCICGKVLSHRDTDREQITLSDMLEMVRLHSNA